MSDGIAAFQLSDPALHPIADKVLAGERLDAADGVALYATADLLGLGRLADFANARRNGDRVLFSANQHINPTNVCVLRNTCVVLLVRADAEGGGRVHPVAGGGVPRGGAGARACRRASSTSWAGSIPSSG